MRQKKEVVHVRSDLTAKTLLLALLLSALVPSAARAQVAAARAGRTLSQTVRWHDLLVGGVRVRLDVPVENVENLSPARVMLVSLPSGEAVAPAPSDSVTLEPGKVVVVKLGRHVPPDPFDDRLRIIVELRPPSAPVAQQSAEDAEAQLAENLRALKLLRETVRGWLAYSKTTHEKHLFISPSLSAPGGGGGELGIHPVLYKGNVLKMNRPINQIEFGLDMNKFSANSADANFLNVGFNFRKIMPLKRKKALDIIHRTDTVEKEVEEAKRANALDAPTAARLSNEIRFALDDAKDFREPFFRALVITPFSPRAETNLKALKPGPVINFVNNTEFQLRTGTRALILSNLLWSFNLIPLGLESGVTLRNQDLPSMKGQGILRLDTGAAGKIALHFPCRSDILANRIQFEFKAVNRHLLRDESAFDRVTKRYDALVRGDRYSIQTDLKYVFGFVTPIPRFKRRPALVVTYKNGFFPPGYIFNNAVTFHFTMESDDNDNAADIKAN